MSVRLCSVRTCPQAHLGFLCDFLEPMNLICLPLTGMLLIGFLADWMGRKWGSRMCTSIMTVGCILLTSAAGSAQTFLNVYLTGLFIFGFGVGGE